MSPVDRKLPPLELDIPPVVDPVQVKLGSNEVLARLFGGDRPTRIGRYSVLAREGGGGMGVVYRAYDPHLRREVALKVLRRGSERSTERTVREAQILAQLSHPNVVAIHDVGIDDGRAFLAMEYVEGETLAMWIVRAKPWREVVAVYSEAAHGLAAAHAQGLIHRDFKPGNVMIGPGDRVRVLDFGIATAAGDAGDSSESTAASSSGIFDGVEQTDAGSTVGTPAYMSPEQHAGAELGPQSDQYSLCVALYEALFGVRPFPEEDALQLAAAKRKGPKPPGKAAAGIPSAVVDAVLRGLQPNPEARWPSMGALVGALQDAAARRTITPIRATVLVGVLGAGTALAWHSQTAEACTGPQRIDAVWNDAAYQSLRLQFERASPSAGPPAAERVKAALDTYAAQWRDEDRRNCRATEVEDAQTDERREIREACLHDAASALQSLRTALTKADASVLAASATAVAWLPPIDRCSSSMEPDPQAPAEVRGRVAEVRAALRDARALAGAGQHKQASAAIEGLAPEVNTIGYGPAIASIHVARGRVALTTGDAAVAAEHLEKGFDAALTADDRTLASDAAALLALLNGNTLKIEDGLRWARVARALLGPNPGSSSRLGNILIAESALLTRAERFEDATTTGTTAASMLAATLGPSHPRTLIARVRLAGIRNEDPESAAALDALAETVTAMEATLGPHHPQLSNAYETLAIAEAAAGHHAQSIDAAKQALAIVADNARSDAVRLGPLQLIGHGYLALGELERAAAPLNEAKAIAVQTFGDHHPYTLEMRLDLADLARARTPSQPLAAATREACAAADSSTPPTPPPLLERCRALLATPPEPEAPVPSGEP